MKPDALFALATTTLIAISYPLLRLGYSTPADARAIRISAALALVVQIITFAVARRVTRTNMMVGWGLGTLLRVLTLALYAFLVVPAIALPASAALISLVIFLFLSMLVEPLLLAYDR
jgi:hypothetical protein